ncbi:MAG: phosphotransferase [Planctomycetia bacterium]|nr:phosphotransferase [Planctomycetia bacterium]
MTVLRRHLDILCNYHDDYVAYGVECLGNAGGYSGATFWKVRGKKGTFCLRRWPAEYPTLERLQFIHAVQWHARMEGFMRFPMPVETLEGMSYVAEDGYFWQLEPWMEGKADFRKKPSVSRMVSAMTSLAEFHNAVKTFPVPAEKGTALTSLEHEKRLLCWTDSQLETLNEQILHETDPQREIYGEVLEASHKKTLKETLEEAQGKTLEEMPSVETRKVVFISDLSDSDGLAGFDGWQMGNSVTIPCDTQIRVQEQLQAGALRILQIVRTLREPVLRQLVRVSNQSLRLQPCLHDIHAAHLYFEKEQFQGFIDFGSLGIDTPAVDIARQLNALTGSHPSRWLVGLAAYQSIRPLSAEELMAVQVFRKSTLLTTAIRWLDYIFMQNHPVKCSARLVRRLEKLADALERI